MGKRKPMFAVGEKNNKRTVRFNNSDNNNNDTRHAQNRRRILRYNLQKNSDDDFSMASWEQQALASSKTPRMNNLTAAATNDNCLGTVDDREKAPRKSTNEAQTLPTTKKSLLRTNYGMGTGRLGGEQKHTERLRLLSRSSLEDALISSPKSKNTTQRQQMPLHQIQHPQGQTTLHRNHQTMKIDTDGHPNHNKVSIKLSSSRSTKKESLLPLSPSRPATFRTVFPAKSRAFTKPQRCLPNSTPGLGSGRRIHSQRPMITSPVQHTVGHWPDSLQISTLAQKNKNDADDMDCDSSGDSCLESTSSSSNASSLTSTTFDSEMIRIHQNSKFFIANRKDSYPHDQNTKQNCKSVDRSSETDHHNCNYHHMNSTLSSNHIPPANKVCSIKESHRLDDSGPLHKQETGVDNKEFFEQMMNSETPTTTKKNTDILGSTVGADGSFILHDDDSDITSLSRASKTPKRKLFPFPSSLKKTPRGVSGDKTPALIDEIPFVAHQERNNRLNDGNDIDEESIEAWSVDGITTLPFEFEIDGKHYAHPALPPGWKMRLSRTHKKPVYIHPDHGRTWYCPVVLPHQSMNTVYARSSLRTIGTYNAVNSGPKNSQQISWNDSIPRNQPSLTPPSPPSSTVSQQDTGHTDRQTYPVRTSDVDQTSARKKRLVSSSVLENLPNLQVGLVAKDGERLSKTLPKLHEENLQAELSKSFPHKLHEGDPNKTSNGIRSHISSARLEGLPDTPGTMSELLRSYENEKTDAERRIVLSPVNQSSMQSGYECDISRATESSSSGVSSENSKDQPLLRCTPTPRRKCNSLPSILHHFRGDEKKLSPIDEAPETHVHDSYGHIDNTVMAVENEGKESLPDHNTKRTSNPFETPHIQIIKQKQFHSKSGTSSKSCMSSGDSKEWTKDLDVKITSAFRTPKSYSSFETEESAVSKQNGELEEVAVLRHGSSRRKKCQTPLLSSAGRKSGSGNSKKMHSTTENSTREKNDMKTCHSLVFSNNTAWSPLINQEENITNSSCGHHDIIKSPPHNRNIDSDLRCQQDSVPTNIPNPNGFLWYSPNVSGGAPGSAELSTQRPIRADIQTPTTVLSEHSNDDEITNSSQVKRKAQAEVGGKLKRNKTATRGDEKIDQTTAHEEHKRGEEKILDTRESFAVRSESPVVFDTYGDDNSEGSMTTPQNTEPTSSEKKKMLSSDRSIRSTNTSIAGIGIPLFHLDVDPDETEEIHGSDDDHISAEGSCCSFKMVDNVSPASSTCYMYDESSQCDNKSVQRRSGWRVLHPPHPLCSLQRLHEILSQSQKMRRSKTTKAKGMVKKKPKKSCGLIIQKTKRQKRQMVK